MAPLESEAAYTVVRSVYKPWIEACSVVWVWFWQESISVCGTHAQATHMCVQACVAHTQVLQDASLDAAACGLKTTALKVILVCQALSLRALPP